MKTTTGDTIGIERLMCMKGKSSHSKYKATILQNDLSIEVDALRLFRQWS
jgi:hypothetical protein